MKIQTAKTLGSMLAVALVALLGMNQSSFGVLIADTSFSGRTVSGDTAQNITWAVNGITDPGDLTALDVNSTGSLAGLFDTANSAGYFAPNLNVANEGPWSVDIPLNFAPGTASIAIEAVVIDWQHFNNSGAFQSAGINRPVNWTASIVGSLSGTVAFETENTGSGGQGYKTLTFGTPTTLTNAETWTLNLNATSTTGSGNNTGIDRFAIIGTVTVGSAVPEPATATLAMLGLGGLMMRRRRNA
jgi:hypothetical protein